MTVFFKDLPWEEFDAKISAFPFNPDVDRIDTNIGYNSKNLKNVLIYF